MFGFLRKKIKGFVDSFGKEAEEEAIEEPPADENTAPEPVPVQREAKPTPDAQQAPSAASPTSPERASEGPIDEQELLEAGLELDVQVQEAESEPKRAGERDDMDRVAADIDSALEPEPESETDRILSSTGPIVERETLEASPPETTTDEDESIELEPVVEEPVVTEAESLREEVPVEPEPKVETQMPIESPPAAEAEVPDLEEPAEPEAIDAEPSAEEGRPKRRGFGSRIMGALSKRSLSDQQFESLFEDLEIGLLEANTAFDAVQAVKENLRERLTGERVSRFSAHDDVERALKESIAALFEAPEDLVALASSETPLVIMLIGINGSGKTTTAAKLAHAFQKAGKRPVLAAADTFRAAAIQQLEEHAKRLDVRIIKHDYGADPAAVAYDAISHATSGKADVVLIDTAGRLHSNENLLKELEKIKRVAKPHRVIFVGESIAGNDLLEQAETFNEKIGIDGIILTKTDVDDRGGGALSVSHVTKKPIDYLGGGQGYDDLVPFSVGEIARLLGLE